MICRANLPFDEKIGVRDRYSLVAIKAYGMMLLLFLLSIMLRHSHLHIIKIPLGDRLRRYIRHWLKFQ
jgi:hypothetical protein